MPDKEEFDFFIEQMYGNAIKEFGTTQQHRLLRDRLDQMDADCELNVNPDDLDFVTECFELILDAKGQQEHYVYRKGMTDCVKVLKWLGVLA